MMNKPDSQPQPGTLKIKIGEWILYPSLNMLERDTETVQLEPKAVAVLEFLVRRDGEPVTRQELLDHVWVNSVVSDDALTQVIIKLRKALGDDSRKPDYIQTIPKRGYRLLASVEVIHEEHAKKIKAVNKSYAYLVGGLLSLVAIFFLLFQPWQSEDTNQLQKTEQLLAAPMSISVLPFKAVGESPKSVTFSLGITSDLMTDLSKLSGLRVIHISEGGQIHSRYQVTGNVQQFAQELKLYVNLLDSETQQQLWSERYEGSLNEIFDMQQMVSEDIVRQLSVNVTKVEKQRLSKRYTRNLTAYENFLSGRAELLHREKAANEKAREWYRQAIENDTGFARAYAGLALSYAADFRNQWVDDGELALKKARDMSETAYQIDPTIPEIHWVLGYIDVQHKKHEDALKSLIQAIELDPSYADAYALMGGVNTYIGKPRETLRLLREAIRLRPDAG